MGNKEGRFSELSLKQRTNHSVNKSISKQVMDFNRVILITVALISLNFALFSETVAQSSGKKQDVDLVFIGNSITLGVSLENRDAEAPPVKACEFLRQKSDVGEVRFYNNGKNGFTTVDFLPSGKSFPQLVDATRQLHSDTQRLLIFSISLGTNDSAMEGTNGAPVSPETYYSNLQLIINQLLVSFPNCKIIIQQPIWYSPNTQNNSRYLAEGLSRLQSYFPQIKALANHYSTVKPVVVFRGDVTGFEYFRKNYQSLFSPEKGKKGTFYLHPNKKGAEILGGLWGKAIYTQIFNH